MDHPYGVLIEQEVTRAEEDLSAFRARSLTVVTTTSGLITLLTGVIAFGASRAEADRGIPDAAIALLAIAMVLLLAAAVLALRANSTSQIDRPSGSELARITEPKGWRCHDDDTDEYEREVAEVLVKYLVSVRAAGGTAASRLNTAIRIQIAGLSLAAAAGLVIILPLD